jgi:hypothetical protein
LYAAANRGFQAIAAFLMPNHIEAADIVNEVTSAADRQGVAVGMEGHDTGERTCY